MKRVILFKEGFCNLIKVNMYFHGTDEDMWVSVVDKVTLYNFIRMNKLITNSYGHIIMQGEIWGVIQ